MDADDGPIALSKGWDHTEGTAEEHDARAESLL